MAFAYTCKKYFWLPLKFELDIIYFIWLINHDCFVNEYYEYIWENILIALTHFMPLNSSYTSGFLMFSWGMGRETSAMK